MNKRALIFSLVVAAFVAVAAYGQVYRGTGETIVENQHALQVIDGFCANAGTGTASSEWWSSAAPRRVTETIKGRIRWFTMCHQGSANASERVCWTMDRPTTSDAGTTYTEAVTCDPEGSGASKLNTGGILTGYGACTTVHVKRTPKTGAQTGDLPDLYLTTETNNIPVCITYGY